jgi:hypothetical protein
MAHELIAGLAVLALLSQAQSAGAPASQSRPYTIEFLTAGVGARKVPQQPSAPIQDVRPSLSARENLVERGPCNMPIVVANPAIDPKMVVPIERKHVDPKIRVVEPTACGGLQQPAGSKR